MLIRGFRLEDFVNKTNMPILPNQPYPRVLHVDTSFAPDHALEHSLWAAKIHYKDIAGLPGWQRKIEQKLRLDFSLARLAKRMSKDFDVLLVGSEKGGIPLSWMGVDKPVITIVHQIITPPKRFLVGTAQAKWSRVGTWAKADGDLMMKQYGYPESHLFSYVSSPLDRFDSTQNINNGPMMSLGVAKRDYTTLVNALRNLPQCSAEIFVSSRYKDQFQGALPEAAPDWVKFEPPISEEGLKEKYKQARFVIVPLMTDTVYSAGCTGILEAAAAGKAVIATRTLWTQDYIRDGVTGILVPPGDAEAMRQAIDDLWRNPTKAEAMGKAARKFAETNYDPEIVNANTQRVITEAHLDYKQR